MYLKYIQIVNFRNLLSSKFQFDEGANTIIGENDAGKSNAITAMRILLDSSYYYNVKRLKETDFPFEFSEWKGHWIIISAFFDKLTEDDKSVEVCAEMIPENENAEFLKSYIRCEGYNYGVVTVFIRPNKRIRKALYEASGTDEFEEIRKNIKLTDYEFVYTARSQVDFTNPEVYKNIVGDIENKVYSDPDNVDMSLTGSKIEILDVWSHLSVVFIDALRDVGTEMHKPKNPIRRIIDAIQSDIELMDLETIQEKIRDLNATIANVRQISDIGVKIGNKMDDIIGMVYSPDIMLESKIKEDLPSISRNLTISTTSQHDIELLGLGHLNMLYIALKLVEFEYNRNHEVMNIMLIEEPEAHIHAHIQKTLFDKLQISTEYTQVVMTTHSAQLSEIAEIKKVNVMKIDGLHSVVMQPGNGLDEFGEKELKLNKIKLSKRLEKYLDAKRSVLLFSKGVILVEGDAEEIMLPSMVKKTLGVSLDELGIGVINIGSVSFEYVASIFAEERLRRRCAIVTDLDAILENAEKCKKEAADRGKSRKEKLERLFGNNKYVQMFYANYTFEVDFTNIEKNRFYYKQVIEENYQKEDTIKKHKDCIDESEAKRYDTVISVANYIGKGWLAMSLADDLDYNVVIPDYLLRAVAFSGGKSISDAVLWKMLKYTVKCNEEEDISDIKDGIQCSNSLTEQNKILKLFCTKFPETMLSKLVKYMEENGDR